MILESWQHSDPLTYDQATDIRPHNLVFHVNDMPLRVRHELLLGFARVSGRMAEPKKVARLSIRPFPLARWLASIGVCRHSNSHQAVPLNDHFKENGAKAIQRRYCATAEGRTAQRRK
jgi:hypothetical protein